tara:strand:- start:786 stop:935 length:150 start_codon:yes stop_codon:yes gene_type:complete
MVTTPTWLVEREFLDEKVPGSDLDAATQIGVWKQSTLRKRIECRAGFSS